MVVILDNIFHFVIVDEFSYARHRNTDQGSELTL